MKKPVALSATLAAAALSGALFLGPVPANAATPDAATVPAPAAPAAQAGGTNLSPAAQQNLSDRLLALLPAGYQDRATALAQRYGLADSPARALLNQAIDPGQYQCSTTALSDWLTGTVQGWTVTDLIDALVVIDLPTYDALMFADGTAPQTFGTDGQFTTPLEHTFRDLKQFWDIPSAGTQLVPMHGDMLLDPARVARTAQYVYGMTPDTAARFGALVAQIFDQPVFDHGNAPIFTFNSVSYASLGKEDFPGLGVLPNKIVMGDGVMEGYDALGLGDVAPRAILAHEFGHQNQYADGQTASDLPAPEASRRIELMADAYSAYFLTHARGEALNFARVQQFVQTFYDVGDCSFTSTGHHGTPDQRMRSAEWGYQLAADAQKQGHILPSAQFGTLFDQELPVIVAPDAS